MATALSLIESAMSKIGMLAAGETVSAEDAAVGILRLNALMDSLENEGFFAYATADTIFTLPANTTSRTIGPAMQIALTRPVKLLSGSFCRIGVNDYPLDPISEPEYNAISLKSSVGSVSPCVAFYDGGTPTGNVYFWPVAATSVEVHLITPTASTQATDTTTSFVLPPGYQRYIEFALAIDLAPDFNTTPNPAIIGAAANAKRQIKRTNARTPQLTLDRLSSGYGASPADFYGGY